MSAVLAGAAVLAVVLVPVLAAVADDAPPVDPNVTASPVATPAVTDPPAPTDPAPTDPASTDPATSPAASGVAAAGTIQTSSSAASIANAPDATAPMRVALTARFTGVTETGLGAPAYQWYRVNRTTNAATAISGATAVA